MEDTKPKGGMPPPAVTPEVPAAPVALYRDGDMLIGLGGVVIGKAEDAPAPVEAVS